MVEDTLSGEEIVEALECCSKSWDCNNCKRDKENNNRFICSENLMKDCLDLIYRLQDEKQKVVQDYYCEAQHCDNQKDVIANQKAEIERLKLDLKNEKNWGKIQTKQAVEDTAKKYDDFIHALICKYNTDIGDNAYGNMHKEANEFAKKNGIQVEQ